MAKTDWDKPAPNAPAQPFNHAATEQRAETPQPLEPPVPAPTPAPRPRGPMGEIATEASRAAQSRDASMDARRAIAREVQKGLNQHDSGQTGAPEKVRDIFHQYAKQNPSAKNQAHPRTAKHERGGR